jgi:hypothetical protein
VSGGRREPARIEALRAHLAAQRAEGARLRESLRVATISRDLALELLRGGGGGEPSRLAVLPWLAAIFATVASLFAVFCAYVTALAVSPGLTTLGLISVVAASVAGLVSRRPGAGGHARRWLRGLATFASVLAAVVLLLAVRR